MVFNSNNGIWESSRPKNPKKFYGNNQELFFWNLKHYRVKSNFQEIVHFLKKK